MTGKRPDGRTLRETPPALGPEAYEVETCFDCDGAGIVGRDLDDCETCAATGSLFTEAAIALQVAFEEALRRYPTHPPFQGKQPGEAD